MVSSRFYRWRKQGIWEKILKALQCEANVWDWDVHQMDRTVVRAHQHAAGAKKGAENRVEKEGLERSRGGFSLKRQ